MAVAMSALGRTFASSARGPARSFTSSCHRHGFEQGEVGLGVRQRFERSTSSRPIPVTSMGSSRPSYPEPAGGPSACPPGCSRSRGSGRKGLPSRQPTIAPARSIATGAFRREGAAVPGGMKAVRRCGRHDVPEGIACPAPEHHEAPDTAPIRESVGDGHVDRMARLKHETQQLRRAGDHRRALLGNGTGVLDVSQVRHWHPSIRPHDLSGIGPRIARSPAPSLNLGDEFRHHDG